MQISAECRWFTQSKVLGKALGDWFLRPVDGIAPGGGNEPRQDVYLVNPNEIELGLKRRGSKPGVEIKGLVDTVHRPLSINPFNATIEIWSKWTCTQIDLDESRTITVDKTRRLRKFGTPGSAPIEITLGPDELPSGDQRLPNQGCNVEFTTIGISNTTWYSFGLEAFGPLETVEASLRAVANVMATRNPPPLKDVIEASYPKWLNILLSAHSKSQEPEILTTE